MTTTEERMRILKMIEDKQITAEEGAKLLEALRVGTTAETRAESSRPRWLRVRVTDRASGKLKVNVNIPVGLIDVGLKMGARFAPEMNGMDLNAIQEAIRGGMQGRILEVEDEKDNERVEIFVE
ncbi:MAG: hypothetical protein N2439_12230 [Anaerolineae bacterium]|nr:hypothetical protein [Anaerolineae bacterium]